MTSCSTCKFHTAPVYFIHQITHTTRWCSTVLSQINRKWWTLTTESKRRESTAMTLAQSVVSERQKLTLQIWWRAVNVFCANIGTWIV